MNQSIYGTFRARLTSHSIVYCEEVLFMKNSIPFPFCEILGTFVKKYSGQQHKNKLSSNSYRMLKLFFSRFSTGE